MRKLSQWLQTDSTVLWSTIVACAILAIADVVGSIVTPGYSASRETTSQLMSPDVGYAWLMRAGATVYALLLVPIAIRISMSSYFVQPWRSLAVAGVWAHIILGFVVSAFQNDARESFIGEITVNRVHDVSAILMFAVAMAVVLVSALARGYLLRSASSRFSSLVFAVMLITGVIFALELQTELNGVYERVIAVAFMVWLVAIAFAVQDRRAHSAERSGVSSRAAD